MKAIGFTIISLLLSFGQIASAGVIGSGGSSSVSISMEEMFTLDRNFNSDFIKIKSLSEPVRSLQDFQTSNGQRGMVVETKTGIPIIVLESEKVTSELPK